MVLRLPPGGEPPGTQAKARILLAGAPGMHKKRPGAQILPNTDTAERSCPTAHTGTAPPENDLTMTGTPARAGLTAPGTGRRELLAVSQRGQSWIIASILSRRPEGMLSHLACGTGTHRINHEARIHRSNRSNSPCCA